MGSRNLARTEVRLQNFSVCRKASECSVLPLLEKNAIPIYFKRLCFCPVFGGVVVFVAVFK